MTGGRAPSTALRVRHVQKAAESVLMSLRIGKWLNRSITIQFATARLDDEARPFLRRFLKLARDWLAKRGAGSLCFVAAFEAKGGLHVHLLLHVPIGLWSDFRDAERHWLRRALAKHGGEDCPEVLRDRAIVHYKNLVCGVASERDYLKQLGNTLVYRMKGATRMNAARYMGMSDEEIENLTDKMRPSPQGLVWGRRVSVSHNLLSHGISPTLHPDPQLTWIGNANREIAAGRASHAATLKLGDPPLGIGATPPRVYHAAHRRKH